MTEQRGGWLVHQSEEKYRNAFMTVIEDQVTAPDGKPSTYGRVNVKNGVAVIAVDAEEQVYLVRLYRYAVARECLEAISGGMDGDEDPLSGAKRELKEEAGITAEEWLDLGVCDPYTSIINAQVYLFAARGLTFGEQAEDTEQPKVEKVPLAEAVQLVLTSQITHSPSALAILKYAFTARGA